MKIIEVHLPEYVISTKPDYEKLGRLVDKHIETNFPNGKYIVRAISSDDHEDLSLDELVEIVTERGTDKYDPNRKGVCHEEFSGFDYDIQAGTIEIKNSKLIIPSSYKYKTEFGDIIYHFYEHTPFDRGYPVRIDLLIIYDIKKLRQAQKFNKNVQDMERDLHKYLYKFTNPENKKDALIGMVKITR